MQAGQAPAIESTCIVSRTGSWNAPTALCTLQKAFQFSVPTTMQTLSAAGTWPAWTTLLCHLYSHYCRQNRLFESFNSVLNVRHQLRRVFFCVEAVQSQLDNFHQRKTPAAPRTQIWPVGMLRQRGQRSLPLAPLCTLGKLSNQQFRRRSAVFSAAGTWPAWTTQLPLTLLPSPQSRVRMLRQRGQRPPPNKDGGSLGGSGSPL